MASSPHRSPPSRPTSRSTTPLASLTRWLSSIDGVKGLVCLGHAGEGTYLTAEEQVAVIRTMVEAPTGCRSSRASPVRETRSPAWRRARHRRAAPLACSTPPTAGCGSATRTAPRRSVTACQRGVRAAADPFQYPDATKATYNLETQLEIAAQPGVFATKNGVRNMRRWDTEIPVLRNEFPDLQILTCHDEYLLHTMFDVDALVGYGGLAPEPLIELIAAGKAQDYAAARSSRPAAAGHQGGLSPGSHGRHGRAEVRPQGPRHPDQRRRPPAAPRPAARCRGRDHPRPEERRVV